MREELELLARPESKASFLKSLDSLIATLSRLRAALTDPSLEAKTVEIQKPLEQVIGFLEFAKNDEFLRTILSPVKKLPSPKPKRQPIKIPSNLTNEQIRSLLEKDLTKDELAAIAAQREISIGELNREESKRSILKNLERQEGYQRLASS
jgi:hypothetical protein